MGLKNENQKGNFVAEVNKDLIKKILKPKERRLLGRLLHEACPLDRPLPFNYEPHQFFIFSTANNRPFPSDFFAPFIIVRNGEILILCIVATTLSELPDYCKEFANLQYFDSVALPSNLNTSLSVDEMLRFHLNPQFANLYHFNDSDIVHYALREKSYSSKYLAAPDHSQIPSLLFENERLILELLWWDAYSSTQFLSHHYIRYITFISNSYLNEEEHAFGDTPHNPVVVIQKGHVVYLRIDGGHMKTLPGYISQLTHLRKLELVNTPIQSLPDSLKNLAHLHSLTLYSNKFTRFPAVIFSLKSLKNLHLQIEFGISEMPTPNFQLPSIQQLHIIHSEIQSLPLHRFPNLKYLELKYCSISSLNFKAQSRLLVLKLISLPELCEAISFESLWNVRMLIVRNCPKWTFPNSISHMNNLRSLRIPIKMLQFSQILPSNTELRILQYYKSEIPHFLSQLSNLMFLDVSSYMLKRLPSWIFKLKSKFENNPLLTLSDIPIPYTIDIYKQLFKTHSKLDLCPHGTKLLRACLLRDFPIDHNYVEDGVLRYRCSSDMSSIHEFYLETQYGDYIIREILRECDDHVRYLNTKTPDLTSLYDFYAFSPENLFERLIKGESLHPLQLQRLAHEACHDLRYLLEKNLPSDHHLFKDPCWKISIVVSDENCLLL